jgi:hypothetical protein
LSEAANDHDVGHGDRTASRRVVVVGVAWWSLFAVTRLLPLVLTLYPSLYGPDVSDPTGDINRYAGWANQIIGQGLVPYREVDVEYPPGSLPFVVVPEMVGQAQFSRPAFVAMMIVVDAVAYGTLLLLARRTGEGERQRAGGWGATGEGERQRAGGWGATGEGEHQRAGGWGATGEGHLGVVTWLLLPPVLGVLLYGRLDLLPAVALLVALERAHARRWFTSGVWFGLGAAAKLVPVLFVPLAMAAAAGRRTRLLAGVVAGGLVAWLPFAGHTGELIHDVLGYHSARGIHLESVWGSWLNLERVAGGPVELVFEYGAFHIVGPGAGTMLRWTTALSIAIVVISALIATARWWRRPQRARLELPLAVTATLALLLGTGRVFSPQFIVWLLATAAVLFTVRPRVALWAGPLLLAIVVMTAVGYPLAFDLLRDGEHWPALLLVYRNVAVIAFGVLLMLHWLWPQSSAGEDLP